MRTIKSEFIGTDATGKDFYRVIIVSESAPDSFPTSGADVDGVPDIAGIAAGSVLLTPDGNSVLYTDDFNGGGGGTPVISFINNLTEIIPAGTVAYASSIEAFIGGDMTLLEEVPIGGTVSVTMTIGSAILAQAGEITTAGSLVLKDYGGTPYYEVQGDGSMTFTDGQ